MYSNCDQDYLLKLLCSEFIKNLIISLSNLKMNDFNCLDFRPISPIC